MSDCVYVPASCTNNSVSFVSMHPSNCYVLHQPALHVLTFSCVHDADMMHPSIACNWQMGYCTVLTWLLFGMVVQHTSAQQWISQASTNAKVAKHMKTCSSKVGRCDSDGKQHMLTLQRAESEAYQCICEAQS